MLLPVIVWQTRSGENSLVLPDSISAPFLVQLFENVDFMYLSWLIPPILFLVMIFRGAFQHLRILWKQNRGTIEIKNARENLIHLRFELSSWVFILGCLIYLIMLFSTIRLVKIPCLP